MGIGIRKLYVAKQKFVAFFQKFLSYNLSHRF